MKQSSRDFVDKVIIYYSQSKHDIVVGHCLRVVKSPKTNEKALLVDDYVTGKQIVLRKKPKILTLEMYELQNKMRFRMYFLLKMMGYQEVSGNVIHLDKTIRQLIPSERIDALENILNGLNVLSPEFTATMFHEGPFNETRQDA